MCGIFAFLGRTDVSLPLGPLRAGLDVLRQRGPDASHEWSERNAWLGHRRLAIIDLDPRAEQPMLSACGRYVISFNGEIYNYRQLRQEILNSGDPYPFKTEGDTEVILALYSRHGAAMLPKLRGMFGFVIWDRKEQQAFVARDPYGIKPVYIGRCSSGVLVSSQVRAIMRTGLVARGPSATGQAGFWLLGSVPEPETWFRDVMCLPAGHATVIRNDSVGAPSSWWEIGDDWRADPERNHDDVREGCREAIRKSVAAHLVADVPIGVFLSGGIDSGTLASLMVEAGAKDLHGVTIAYQEYAGRHEDEAPAAAVVARQFGIKHHVKVVQKAEFEADLDRMVSAMDQPTIDGLNTWYASKAVAELGLKVIVSGIGGDELFHGYGLFEQIPWLVRRWQQISRLPGAGSVIQAVSNIQAARSGRNKWRHLPEWAASIASGWWLRRGLFAPGDLPTLMGPELADQALEEFAPERWIAQMCGPLPSDAESAIALIESTTYLRNQLLRDSDWASMDHSVELRTPLVDAWMLREMRPFLRAFSRFPNKQLLASAPAMPISSELLARPKSGFGIPVLDWTSTTGSPSPTAWARSVAARYGKQWGPN